MITKHQNQQNPHYTIATSAFYHHNHRLCGYAYLITGCDGQTLVEFTNTTTTTANRSELMALVESLEALPKHLPALPKITEATKKSSALSQQAEAKELNRLKAQAIMRGEDPKLVTLEQVEQVDDNSGQNQVKVIIVSTSSHLLDGLLHQNIAWAASNWTKFDGKPVLNVDLWRRAKKIVDDLYAKQVKFSGLPNGQDPHSKFLLQRTRHLAEDTLLRAKGLTGLAQQLNKESKTSQEIHSRLDIALDTQAGRDELATADFILYTDGSSLIERGSKSDGGWAFILKANKTNEGGEEAKEGSGRAEKTTNNRMELTAAIKGLECVLSQQKGQENQTNKPKVVIVSDSEYVVKGLLSWMKSWKRHGWRRNAFHRPATSSIEIINVDLWQQLDKLCQQLQVSARWVRGHNGHPENERCDELATAARTKTSISCSSSSSL